LIESSRPAARECGELWQTQSRVLVSDLCWNEEVLNASALVDYRRLDCRLGDGKDHARLRIRRVHGHRYRHRRRSCRWMDYASSWVLCPGRHHLYHFGRDPRGGDPDV